MSYTCLGLRNPGVQAVAENFEFVDGSPDGTDFFRINGRYPWADGQPNNFFGPGDPNQECVS